MAGVFVPDPPPVKRLSHRQRDRQSRQQGRFYNSPCFSQQQLGMPSSFGFAPEEK